MFGLSQSALDGALLLSLFRFLFITVAILYIAFAFVVTRQIKIMRTTLITSFSPLVRVLGYAHLLLAVAVLVIFLLVL
jgi:hypothetical protein